MSPDNTLVRIAKLLRQAESTDNPHEAETFMAAAQVLAAKHSIELAVARAHTAKLEARETPTEETIEIGKRGKRGLNRLVRLYAEVGRPNDVETLWRSDCTAVYAYGFHSDIEVTTALYVSLALQMVEAGNRYIDSGVWVLDSPHKLGARLAFYDGFIQRIGQRLATARAETEREATAVSDSTELALVEKRAEVQLFVKQRNAGVRIRRSGWPGSSGGAHSHRAGSDAADKARLGRQHAAISA